MNRSRLKQDVQQVMDWQRRSREKAARRRAERQKAGGAPYSSLRRSDGPKRGKSRGGAPSAAKRLPRQRPEPVGPLSPAEWRAEVWRLCSGRSIISGIPVRLSDGLWVWQAHHPLPKRFLPPELKYHPDNGVVLLTPEHKRHEDRFVDRTGYSHVIPLERLPGRTLRFAERLGTEYVELLHRQHPPAARLEGGTPNQEVVDGRRADRRRSRP